MRLDPDKYARTITLHCPTCGGIEFETDAADEFCTCTRCSREITREDLERENAAHIEANVDEVKEMLAKDFTKQLRDAFRGNKYIKIK